MRYPTNNCNFNIIRNEVNEHEELAALVALKNVLGKICVFS